MKSMFKQVKKHPLIAGIGGATVLSFFGKTAGFMAVRLSERLRLFEGALQ